jgi:hypothetical protein
VRQPVDAAGPPGEAIKRLVVERQQDPVGSCPGVGLQVGVAKPGRMLEGAQGILRAMRRPAAVGEGERTRAQA